MPRLWYPERFHVQVIAHKLAEHLFPNYDSPLPAFSLFGGEREGGALLDSALALPKQTFDGRYLYKRWYEKAGVLLRSLIKNHPLVDGNKRIALATTFVFLLMNDHFLLATNKGMVQFALQIAASEPDMSWRKIARWIQVRSVRIAKFNELAAEAEKQKTNKSRSKTGQMLEEQALARWREETTALPTVFQEFIAQLDIPEAQLGIEQLRNDIRRLSTWATEFRKEETKWRRRFRRLGLDWSEALSLVAEKVSQSGHH